VQTGFNLMSNHCFIQSSTKVTWLMPIQPFIGYRDQFTPTT